MVLLISPLDGSAFVRDLVMAIRTSPTKPSYPPNCTSLGFPSMEVLERLEIDSVRLPILTTQPSHPITERQPHLIVMARSKLFELPLWKATLPFCASATSYFRIQGSAGGGRSLIDNSADLSLSSVRSTREELLLLRLPESQTKEIFGDGCGDIGLRTDIKEISFRTCRVF